MLTLLNQVPLDAPAEIQYGAEWAAARLDPSQGVKEVTLRIKKKYDAGLPVVTEIDLLGNLPSTEADSALVDVAKLPLNHDERQAFVSACKKVASAPLVPALATMLVPAQQDIWWTAVDALMKIDTDDAAKALQPHLVQETNLQRKIEIAEFLGRHGIRDGYPYAIEHMSEPYLREEAISALAAIREPRAVGELRKILETSNDVAWNSAAVRALGALGTSDFVASVSGNGARHGKPARPFRAHRAWRTSRSEGCRDCASRICFTKCREIGGQRSRRRQAARVTGCKRR